MYGIQWKGRTRAYRRWITNRWNWYGRRFYRAPKEYDAARDSYDMEWSEIHREEFTRDLAFVHEALDF